MKRRMTGNTSKHPIRRVFFRLVPMPERHQRSRQIMCCNDGGACGFPVRLRRAD
ncbi:MAG: hypothetical protein ABI476_06225 [Oxalobacteraceae bacterium]